MNCRNKAGTYVPIEGDQISNSTDLKTIGTSNRTRSLGYLIFILVLINCSLGMASAGEPLSSLLEIDVSETTRAIIVIKKGNAAEKEAIAKEIQSKSESYAPYAFFVLSEYFYKQRQTEDAVFWYNAGILRCWYDASRSTFRGAKQEIDLIGNTVPRKLIDEQYAAIARLKRIVDRVIEWDERTPYRYDPRWIYLYSMENESADEIRRGPDVPSKRIAMNLPEEQWADIAADVRKRYRRLKEKDIESYKATNRQKKSH